MQNLFYAGSIPARFIFIAIFSFNLQIFSQGMPIGYVEQYTHLCNNQSLFKTLIRSDSSLWKINNDASLTIAPVNESEIQTSIGVFDKMVFGEYIIEFDFRFDNKISDTSAFTFLGNMKSKDSYYAYSFSADTLRFYVMYRGRMSLIDKKPIPKLRPGWNKAHIEWNILSRNSTIILNNNQNSTLTFNDNKLIMGFLGFSNGHIATSIKNIKIWAPTCITDTVFNW